MTRSIRKELSIAQPCERVWEAITNRETLAEWMFPNDFEPRVGHRFTFRVPPNPKAGFEGLTVECEVLVCEPPHRLKFSWSAGGPVVDTRVTFQLQAEQGGTRLLFEHSGFDMAQPWAEQAVHGAESGWARMLKKLSQMLVSQITGEPG